MSRAFVKEDDSELPGDDLPERPQSPHPNYVTSHGLKALQRRVEKLQEERRALTESGVELVNYRTLERAWTLTHPPAEPR